jgi:hypothetical protein
LLLRLGQEVQALPRRPRGLIAHDSTARRLCRRAVLYGPSQVNGGKLSRSHGR